MTNKHNDFVLLKNKIFKLSDELHTLYDAYEALPVIACGDFGDSRHVGIIVNGLNYRFEYLLAELDKLYLKTDKTGLRVVE